MRLVKVLLFTELIHRSKLRILNALIYTQSKLETRRPDTHVQANIACNFLYKKRGARVKNLSNYRQILDKPQLSYHLPFTQETPSLTEDRRNLFTRAYVDLIEAIATELFPDTQIETDKNTYTLSAASARVDRYILFRTIWDDSFGNKFQKYLLYLSISCMDNNNEKHFVQLTAEERCKFLTALQETKLAVWRFEDVGQKEIFSEVFDAISDGMFADPGYGGNYRGIGWYYSRFMPITD